MNKEKVLNEVNNLFKNHKNYFSIEATPKYINVKADYHLCLKIQNEGTFGTYFWGITIDKTEPNYLRAYKELKKLNKVVSKILKEEAVSKI